MKAPILALLVAGATAQTKRLPRGNRGAKGLELAVDRTKPVDPVKPGDLESCTDDAVTKAKGVHVAAVQSLAGLDGELKPLQTAVDEKMKAKQEAITKVLEKDVTDATSIQADYDASVKEIEARIAFQDKTATWEAAKLALDVFSGRVTVDSGIADNESTKDVQENKKNVNLAKGGSGKLQIAKDALQKAKDKQSEISGALVKANDAYSHWGDDLAIEKGKDLETARAAKAGDLVSANNDVKVYTDAVSTKTTAYDDAKKAYDTAKGYYDKLGLEVTRVQNLIDASSPDALSITWGSERDAFVTQATAAKVNYKAFLDKLKITQGDTVDDYHDFGSGETCDTAQKNNAPNAASSLAACRTACKNTKYLTFFTGYDAGKTDYVDEWKVYYDTEGAVAGSNDGTASKLGDQAGPGFCTGFTFNVGDDACTLWDKLAPTKASGGTSNETCYKRKAVDALGDVQVAWKKYWKEREQNVTSYRVMKAAYIAKIDAGWATFDAKQQAERKRLEYVAELTAMKVKAKKQYDDYNTNTLSGLNSTMGTALSEKNTATGDLDKLPYYQKVNAVKVAQAASDAAVAAKKIVDDKITRIEAIMKHMKDTGDGNKGTIADLTTAKEKVDAEINTAVTGLDAVVATAEAQKVELDKAVTTAKEEYDKASTTWGELKGKAETALTDVKTPLEEVVALRVKVDEAAVALKEAIKGRDEKNGLIKAQQKVVDDALDDLNKKLETCKAAKYDQFIIDVKSAESARDLALGNIEKLIDARAKLAHGATGGRCEKPQSNGDRIRRGKCAGEADCCGAATGRPHGVKGPLVTIEVCQQKDAKTWNYVAPRAPMDSEDPAPETWDFKCIDGASKLAGAAAALLASAYMMA